MHRERKPAYIQCPINTTDHNVITKANEIIIPSSTSTILLMHFSPTSAKLLCFILISATQLLLYNNVETVTASTDDQSQLITTPSSHNLPDHSTNITKSDYPDLSIGSYSSFSDLLLSMGNQYTNSEHDESKTAKLRCESLGRILNRKQLDLCHKHIDLLHLLLTQTLGKALTECQRLFENFKWNCTSIDGFLDRSSPLASTKEASFVRALINAVAAHIVTEACASGKYSSCGCLRPSTITDSEHEQNYWTPSNITPNGGNHFASVLSDQDSISTYYTRFVNVTSLNAGKPILIHKKNHDLPGCNHNIAFGSAFAKTFLDIDDVKSLNKASKILNHNYPPSNSNLKRSTKLKDHSDVDHIELAYLRWTKAAVNLHNSNLGRKVYQDCTTEKCTCHGISGSCQFKTCLRHIEDLETISLKLHMIYSLNSSSVYAHNMGTFEQPDLHLVRRSASFRNEPATTWIIGERPLDTIADQDGHQVSAYDLIYLSASPDFCTRIESIRHTGTSGRNCHPDQVYNTIQARKPRHPKRDHLESTSDNHILSLIVDGVNDADPQAVDSNSTANGGRHSIQRTSTMSDSVIASGHGQLGKCEDLCCDRGYRSELRLYYVSCNCKFNFCCRVTCQRCLKQAQHFHCL